MDKTSLLIIVIAVAGFAVAWNVYQSRKEVASLNRKVDPFSSLLRTVGRVFS